MATIKSLPLGCIESVVINGGSCKESKDFLSSFHGVSLSEPDRGISDAFNKGIHLASEDYITFLNSGDMLVDVDYYRDALEILQNQCGVEFVYADIIFIDQYAGEIKVKSDRSLPHMPFLHPTLIIKKSTLVKAGLFDNNLRIAMDLDLVYRLKKMGLKGHYIARPVVKMDGSGISSSRYVQTFLEVTKIILKNRDLSLNSFFYLSKESMFVILKWILLKFKGGKLLGVYRRKRY